MIERIYILLPVHNRREITRRFILCLKAQGFQDFHLVLINDGCTDGTVEMVRDYLEPLTVIEGKGDWWWSGALQQGYKWLKAQGLGSSDFVLIINDDTEFEPDFLQSGLALLRNLKRSMLLAWCYCRKDGRLVDPGVHVDWSRFSFGAAATPAEINCLSTNGLFMRLSDFLSIGGFHPVLLPHYTSDYEFTIRAQRQGMKLVSDASCQLRLDQTTTGYQKLHAASSMESFRRLFSRKCVRNPFTLSIFVALSCPWRYKLTNLYRVWAWFLCDLYQIVKHRPLNGAEESP